MRVLSRSSDIIIAYGYASTRRVLRRGREKELFTGGGAAGSHPARGQPADPRAREAARSAAARSLGPPGRADRGGRPPLPGRAASAGAGGSTRRGGSRRRRRDPFGAPRARRVDGARQHRPAPPPRRLPRPAAGGAGAPVGGRRPVGRRPRRPP